MILTRKLSRIRYCAVLLLGLSANSWALTQDQHGEYFKKYGGMPPLDIRVFVDGVQAKGMFDLAKEYQDKTYPAGEAGQKLWESMLIPAKVGQKFTFRVEVAKRDSGEWQDVTKHRQMSTKATSKVISINPDKSGGRVVSDPRFPASFDLGIERVIFYYSDRNPKDEQAAYTEIYFDVKGKS